MPYDPLSQTVIDEKKDARAHAFWTEKKQDNRRQASKVGNVRGQGLGVGCDGAVRRHHAGWWYCENQGNEQLESVLSVTAYLAAIDARQTERLFGEATLFLVHPNHSSFP